MVQCVEQRFGDVRAPQKVQWLSDNGSIFAAGRTLEIAVALNLEPCFTPVESPESNGMAEAFVKTFKRDYVRVNPLPDARTALSRIDHWMEDYNSEHPHSRLGYRSPREYIASLQPAAASGDLIGQRCARGPAHRNYFPACLNDLGTVAGPNKDPAKLRN